jgi:16S rRNA (cytosine1402-N4)-methyltransferase
MIHKPVMVAEVIAGLQPRPGGRYIDGTIGMGGHAAAILETSAPTGRLYACDRDGDAVNLAAQRLAPFAGRFEIRRGNYTELGGWIDPGSCDGVLLDLGVSSLQLDEAERGFSFQSDGPLDMRMDNRQPLTAAQLVGESGAEELARIFWQLGEEPNARRLAQAIVTERQSRPLKRTSDLAHLVERFKPRRGRTHPATQVFQALRMAVNDELGALENGLETLWNLVKVGGRFAVITFHSGEDRVVKRFGRQHSLDYTVPGDVDVPELRQPKQPDLRWIQRKAIQPSTSEVAANPRARSAQLRVFERIYGA